VYARNEVYEASAGWESFEPWLSRIEKDGRGLVWSWREIPPRVVRREWDELEKTGTALIGRRRVVRELIEAFRVSPEPFRVEEQA